MRYALITGRGKADAIGAYLPLNYEVIASVEANGYAIVAIKGEDDAGWTFDSYVTPRLQSGLYATHEVTENVAYSVVLAGRQLVARDLEREARAHQANVARIESIAESVDETNYAEANGVAWVEGFKHGLGRALDVLNGKG